jgi:hypothetical protein
MISESFDDQAVTISNLTILIYLIKIKHSVIYMSLCIFQAQMVFIWESVLENNINYILESPLII